MLRRSMDGTTLAIEGLAADDLMVTESCWYNAPPDWTAGVQVTGSEVPERLIEGPMKGSIAGSRTLGAGRLIAADAASDAPLEGSIVAWIGKRYAVRAMLPPGLASVDLAAKLFGHLDPSEDAEGIRLRNLKVDDPRMLRRNFTFGLRDGSLILTVKRIGADSLSLIPAGTGAKVAGGEVWQGECDQDFTLTMLSETAVVVLTSPEKACLTGAAASLRVAWDKRA